MISASFGDASELIDLSIKADYEIPMGPFEVAPDEGFTVTDNVKVYIWDSLETIKPLFKPIRR